YADLLGHVARGAQAIGRDVLRRHGLRDIDREHDVHAKAPRTALTEIDIWAGERDHERRESQEQQTAADPDPRRASRGERRASAEGARRAAPCQISEE